MKASRKALFDRSLVGAGTLCLLFCSSGFATDADPNMKAAERARAIAVMKVGDLEEMEKAFAGVAAKLPGTTRSELSLAKDLVIAARRCVEADEEVKARLVAERALKHLSLVLSAVSQASVAEQAGAWRLKAYLYERVLRDSITADAAKRQEAILAGKQASEVQPSPTSVDLASATRIYGTATPELNAGYVPVGSSVGISGIAQGEGGMRLQLNLPHAGEYWIESSCDLKEWVLVHHARYPAGEAQIQDIGETGSCVFYRVLTNATK